MTSWRRTANQQLIEVMTSRMAYIPVNKAERMGTAERVLQSILLHQSKIKLKVISDVITGNGQSPPVKDRDVMKNRSEIPISDS